MNQDETKAMMLSFERLKAKENKSAQNKMSLDAMWQKMPQIVQHQISVIKEYQEAFDVIKANNEQLEAENKDLRVLVDGAKTIVEVHQTSSPAGLECKKDWLRNAIEILKQ